MENDLKNKVVVITGGAEGIGLEIATQYLNKGAKTVVLLDVQEAQGSAASKELNAQFGNGKAMFLKCNIRNDLDTVYTKIMDSCKQVDVLVNNAGVLDELNPRRTIEINVLALIEFSLKFWEHMRVDKGGNGGTIINLASIYGYRVDPYIPVYQASKFAVQGFTKSLGHEENYRKSGVRVVAINPGFTETKLTSGPKAWNYQSDLESFVATQEWQKVDSVGKAAVEVFEKAPSGTAWLIEGDRPISRV